MKIVHCVCYDKKFIPQQLIFLNEHFSEHEQTFYVMGAHDEFNTIASHNVYRLSQSTLFIFLWDAFKADRIFFNGLFNDFIPIIFLFLPSIVKKGIWTPWGGDLYLKQYRANTFKNRIIEWIRGIFIRRLYGIATGTFGDYIKAKEWYGTNAKYLDSCPNIFSFDLSDLSIIREQAQADKVNKIITIQFQLNYTILWQ